MENRLSVPKRYCILISAVVVGMCVLVGIYAYTTMKSDKVYISGIIEKQDLDDLCEKSCLVTVGTVTGCSDSFQIKSAAGSIANFTDYFFETGSVLRGKAEEKEITVRVQGGTENKCTEVYENSPSLKVGSKYLLFLYRSKRGGAFNTEGNYYYILGLTQGAFSISGSSYISQADLTVSEAELESKLTAIKDTPVDEYYFRNEFIRNQKMNLETGFITQEEYDRAMKNIDVYATIIK